MTKYYLLTPFFTDTITVEHNGIIDAEVLKASVGRQWEELRDWATACGFTVEPVLDSGPEEEHPTELTYRGITYQFKWDGEVLVRVTAHPKDGFPYDVSATQLPTAVQKLL